MYHNGRVFHEGMNGLRAADAYNGRTLWEYSLPNILKQYNADHLMGTAGTGSNFCAAGDSVYVRVKDRCLRKRPAGVGVSQNGCVMARGTNRYRSKRWP